MVEEESARSRWANYRCPRCRYPLSRGNYHCLSANYRRLRSSALSVFFSMTPFSAHNYKLFIDL